MYAYGVFAGGGVKGAALAGCMQAALDHDIEFAGYGGTSAGSIVAALGCVGYTGREIYDLMKAEFHPSRFLDDNGVDLKMARELSTKIVEIITSSRPLPLKGFGLWWKLNKEEWAILRKVSAETGLYEGSSLRKNLLTVMKQKLGENTLRNPTDLTFSDLVRANRPPLKIVASDLAMRRGAVFSKVDAEYSPSVIEAVRASASYPFVFQPPVGTYHTDGGLSSNLPVFLFAQEQREFQYPILAFDLVVKPVQQQSGIIPYLKALLETGLEASDALIINLIRGIEHIQVETPPTIGTLKFDLTPAEVDSLYNTGYSATAAYLAKFERLENAKMAGPDIPRNLWVIYGAPKIYQQVLWAVKKMVEEWTKAENVRAAIMLPTGRPNRSRIVTYTYGFRQNDTDAFLELDEYGGCTGLALKERSPIVADLEDAKITYLNKWGLTQAQQNAVAQDRKSMISCPIFAFTEDKSRVDDLPVMGTLSVDSSTALKDTGWMTAQSIIHSDIYEVLTVWADVIGKLLR